MQSSRMALPCCQIGAQPSHLRDLRAVPLHMTRHDQKAVDPVNGLHHAMAGTASAPDADIRYLQIHRDRPKLWCSAVTPGG